MNTDRAVNATTEDKGTAECGGWNFKCDGGLVRWMFRSAVLSNGKTVYYAIAFQHEKPDSLYDAFFKARMFHMSERAAIEEMEKRGSGYAYFLVEGGEIKGMAFLGEAKYKVFKRIVELTSVDPDGDGTAA